jgi:threonine dehydratase
MTPTETYPDLAAALGIPVLYFKREDLHPYGSHKGRSIPAMMDHYYALSDRSFAITGSGNAAWAAAQRAREINTASPADTISLDMFVGNNIAPYKLERLTALADEHIRVLNKERPLQALTEAVNAGVRSLRQSTDDQALVGYTTLAKELAEIDSVGAVFIGTSSGTTAQALAGYFLKHKKGIQVHIVQTSSCHPIAEASEVYEGPEEESVADAIVDKTALRKDALVPLIHKTGGRGWIAMNDDIAAAQELVQKHTGHELSANSALSIVGAMKAVYAGHEITGAVVCLICGE